MQGSSNKIWSQNGGRNTSITRSDLISSVIPLLIRLIAIVYRLGRKRSKQLRGLSKLSVKLPERQDANCPRTFSIMPSNRPSAIMLSYNPQPLTQAKSIAPQLSPPMALRKIRFKADQPRPRLGLMKILARKGARKGGRGQHR